MKVNVEAYSAKWPLRFGKERTCIGNAMGSLQPCIEHIGSTSIKGMWAKPIIDILVGLPSEQLLDDSCMLMIEAGYTYVKAFNDAMPYRRFFVRLANRHEKIIDVGERRFHTAGGSAGAGLVC